MVHFSPLYFSPSLLYIFSFLLFQQFFPLKAPHLINSRFKDEFTDELEAETTLELSGVGDQMEIGDQARFKKNLDF